VADHDHKRGGDEQAHDRAAQAGVRAQRVCGGEQHEHERQAPQRVVGEQEQQRYAGPDRQPHQQRRAAAQHQRHPHEQGQQRQQPRRPGDCGAADQAGRTPRRDGDQPGRGDPEPGIGDVARVTAHEAPY
jgi:hypothetical protein